MVGKRALLAFMTSVEPKVPRGLLFFSFSRSKLDSPSILATKRDLGVHHLDSLHNIWSFIGQLPRPCLIEDWVAWNRHPTSLSPNHYH
jgi:hypothetical protein